LAEFDDHFRVAPGSSGITTNHLEVGLEQIGVDEGRYMTGFDRVRDGFFDERPRWFDLTELPPRDGEAGPRGRAGIVAESEPGFTIPLGIVNALPNMRARRAVGLHELGNDRRISEAKISPKPIKRLHKV
jgi:hypothetical protein